MFQDSPYSTACGGDEYELDDENEDCLDDDRDLEEQGESDEGRRIFNIYNNFCKHVTSEFLVTNVSNYN